MSSRVPSLNDSWITPHEQLLRLATNLNKDTFYKKFNLAFTKSVGEFTTEYILKHSSLNSDKKVPPLWRLVLNEAIELTPLPSILTNWYNARKKIGLLPEYIPPLPENIFQIIRSKCPIYGDQIKPDGSNYSIADTHTLQLLSQEDRTLNRFEQVIQFYGKEDGSEGTNPLQFRFFWQTARQEYGDVSFEPSHWQLMTKEMLPQSLKRSWLEQLEMIQSLSIKALANYEPPTLGNASRTLFLHKIATNESLYTSPHHYTNVQELTDGWRTIVGGYNSSGIAVTSFAVCDYAKGGIAAIRKL